MRLGLLLALASTLILSVVSAAGATSDATPSVRVTFSGSAQGTFSDTERWVLLTSNECYLRRIRNQSTALSWNVGFTGGRSLSALAAASVKGAVSGTEVRDSCDDVAEELPPDAPADWLHSLKCNDPLRIRRAASASWKNGVLRVQAPVVEVAKNAVCTAVPRSDQLNARIALSSARIAKLRPGAQIRIAVGSAMPTTGSYRQRASCFHIAKPYDGYRSFDECADTLRWTGVVTITRS